MHIRHHLSAPLLLVFALFLVGVNGFFEYYHLYFFLWWLDIPMHFLSGMLVSLVALAVVYRRYTPLSPRQNPIFVLAVALGSALVVGVLWELVAGALGHDAPNIGGLAVDTIKDIANDLFGGLVAALLFIGKGYNKTI